LWLSWRSWPPYSHHQYRVIDDIKVSQEFCINS
jgi:hypothetical protein